MSMRFKLLHDAIFGRLPEFPDIFVSKSLAKDIEEILPGQTLTITVKERQFVILEREEFEVLIEKAGFALKKRSEQY